MKTPSKKTITKKATVKKTTGASSTPKKKTTLVLKGAPGQKVYIAGSFNDWDKSSHPMKEKDGIYTVTLQLDVGIYEYKFLVNDVWTLDPDPARDWTQNAFGTLNSLLRVE